MWTACSRGRAVSLSLLNQFSLIGVLMVYRALHKRQEEEKKHKTTGIICQKQSFLFCRLWNWSVHGEKKSKCQPCSLTDAELFSSWPAESILESVWNRHTSRNKREPCASEIRLRMTKLEESSLGNEEEKGLDENNYGNERVNNGSSQVNHVNTSRPSGFPQQSRYHNVSQPERVPAPTMAARVEEPPASYQKYNVVPFSPEAYHFTSVLSPSSPLTIPYVAERHHAYATRKQSHSSMPLSVPESVTKCTVSPDGTHWFNLEAQVEYRKGIGTGKSFFPL